MSLSKLNTVLETRFRLLDQNCENWEQSLQKPGEKQATSEQHLHTYNLLVAFTHECKCALNFSPICLHETMTYIGRYNTFLLYYQWHPTFKESNMTPTPMYVGLHHVRYFSVIDVFQSSCLVLFNCLLLLMFWLVRMVGAL